MQHATIVKAPMKLAEIMYRTSFGVVMSGCARAYAWLLRPRMIYGYRERNSGKFLKYTRISSTVSISCPERLSIGEHVWVWHNTVIDASGGLTIGEGCQIGASVGIFTHGSNNSIRWLGRAFTSIPAELRTGYVREGVEIGPYTFVGSGVLILPGTRIGPGSVIGPNCVVSGTVPERSIIMAPAARNVGSTLDIDMPALSNPAILSTYYDRELAAAIQKGE